MSPLLRVVFGLHMMVCRWDFVLQRLGTHVSSSNISITPLQKIRIAGVTTPMTIWNRWARMKQRSEDILRLAPLHALAPAPGLSRLNSVASARPSIRH
jgi:hypothetical protein